MQIHPSNFFLIEALGRSAGPSWVREHVEKCPRCRLHLQRLVGQRKFSKTVDYGSIVDRSFLRAQGLQDLHSREKDAAPGLLAALAQHPFDRQKVIIQNHKSFQTWSLTDLLLDQGQALAFDDLGQGEQFAQLALEASGHLDPTRYGTERIEDLRARSWALKGNFHRIRGELDDADKAFERASRALLNGTGDVLERATILSFRASLRQMQDRYDESLQLLKRASAIYQETGEKSNHAKILIKMATAHHFKGDFEQAVHFLRQVIAVIGADTDSRLLLCAWHNLVDSLITGGRIMEAQRVYAKARPLFQRFSGQWAESRRRWVEAKMMRSLGRKQEASNLLAETYNMLIHFGLYQDAALVAKEMAMPPTEHPAKTMSS